MSQNRRQTLLAAALLLIFVFLAWRQWGPGVAGSGLRAGSGFGGLGDKRGTRSPAGAGVLQPITEFRIAELAQKRAKYEPGRDLFRYFVVRTPTPKPAPPKRKTKEEREAERLRAQAAANAQRQEAAKPKPPPVSVEYLGSFGPRDRQIAVFSGEEEIYNAFEGDVLQGKFIVDKIGLESVDLKFVGFPDAPAERLAAGS